MAGGLFSLLRPEFLAPRAKRIAALARPLFEAEGFVAGSPERIRGNEVLNNLVQYAQLSKRHTP